VDSLLTSPHIETPIFTVPLRYVMTNYRPSSSEVLVPGMKVH